MAKRVISVRCPTCRALVLQKEEDFPFCSERCRLIDLGKWASGGYVISTPINDPEQFSTAEENETGRKHETESDPSFRRKGER
jgi:endogenous inhibitor of DNA gyrase (YacG/DUF329 family)